jgi:hypothetical protein
MTRQFTYKTSPLPFIPQVNTVLLRLCESAAGTHARPFSAHIGSDPRCNHKRNGRAGPSFSQPSGKHVRTVECAIAATSEATPSRCATFSSLRQVFGHWILASALGQPTDRDLKRTTRSVGQLTQPQDGGDIFAVDLWATPVVIHASRGQAVPLARRSSWPVSKAIAMLSVAVSLP